MRLRIAQTRFGFSAVTIAVLVGAGGVAAVSSAAATSVAARGCPKITGILQSQAVDPNTLSYLSDAQSASLYNELDYQRAVQAYIWGVPLVNGVAFAKALVAAGLDPAHPGLLIIDKPSAPGQQMLTPSFDIVYALTTIDLSLTGPVLIEVPNGVLGGVIDFRMRALTDIGVGRSKDGGSFVLARQGVAIPQGMDAEEVRSPTKKVFLFGRGPAFSPDQTSASVALLSRIKIRSLRDGQIAQTPPVILQGDRVFSEDWPKDHRYFDYLREGLAADPVETADKLVISFLWGFGIAPGDKAQPTARRTCILERAAATGSAMVINLAYRSRLPQRLFWPGRRWERAVLATSPNFETADRIEVDERAAGWYTLVGNQKYVYSHRPAAGEGTFYLNAYRDTDGEPLDGGRTYQLHLAVPPPVNNFWSFTLYDAVTRARLPTSQHRPSLSSRSGLVSSGDGAIDVYFGPAPPKGGESNWVATRPGQSFFVMFRAYGPLQPILDRSWMMNDITRLHRRAASVRSLARRKDSE